MKITAGFSQIDEYPSLVEAGARELFCGFVPGEWMNGKNSDVPLNRREVSYCNVQIGSISEMHILSDIVKDLGVPVTITLNSLWYSPEQYGVIEEIIYSLIPLGFRSYIVADPGFLDYLAERGLAEEIRLVISGELGEMNHYLLPQLSIWGADRLIFHRKVTLTEMEKMIRHQRESERMTGASPMEFEAFALNEMCHFHGGFCNSLHCDELVHMCQVPYQLGNLEEDTLGEDVMIPQEESDYEGIGASGCGLCALWKMKQIGITHLKLVSRGNYPEETLRDVRALKIALEILERSRNEADYIRKMKQQLFPHGCSGTCYYRENYR